MILLFWSSMFFSSQLSSAMIHTFNKIHSSCRETHVPYPKTQNVFRFYVPDDRISWRTHFPEYSPVEYTHPSIRGQVWADDDIAPHNRTKFEWNTLDENKVNRISHNSNYTIDSISGKPLNPFGRTGITGRGSLGRWGPNHAADPIVTRWSKTGNEIEIDSATGKPKLLFLAIQRRVGKMWAFPGGMVEKGEETIVTAQRELCEEALNSLSWRSDDEGAAFQKKLISELFARAEPVYKGYIDDPRNTDNAWMETIAFHAHDSTGSIVEKLKLQAGDDAVDVKWLDVKNETELFANHNDLLLLVAQKLNAHW